ncbi:MAG: hypothetical protein AB7S50_00520 [Bacteroidales bacterium]
MKKIFKSVIVIILLFSTNNLFSQNKWDLSEIKTKNNTYKSYVANNAIYINNLKFDSDQKDRKQYDIENNEYSYIKLYSHDDFLKGFKETFTTERISYLASKGERIIVFFDINENAEVISIGFSLDKETNLSIEELENLETQILRNVKFCVVGKKITNPIFYSWSIRIFFKEIEKGEIEFARKSENFKGL